MKTENGHTTNYQDTFIETAEDSPVKTAEIPPQKAGGKTVAGLQFDMVYENPYKYTSDDVIFGVFAKRNDISRSDLAEEREKFFSKGQACMRASPLTKRFGWGVHSDSEGKIAIYPVDSEEYKKFANDENLKHTKAMRSKRV
ncbi:DUF6157 family protein [Dyadobacter luticola]|uniref:Uncharacterized protein n=1 Tax=Dyadobacter luticola TaxID=1979387 RepID=A0A5R9KYB8_9BACT|nr:DUF6157 family protein [Dyadobacter luticola]TLV01119.1 hypothetical protein FEN17_16840 [Dyadobacter luticola]